VVNHSGYGCPVLYEIDTKQWTVTEKAMNYANNRIGRVSLADNQSELELMNVELPVGFYETDKETLMIYRYVEEVNFGFLEFDPQEVTLTEAG